MVLTHGTPPDFRGGVHYLYRRTPSGQSRVYRVTQLRTDGVQCRESAGTGPVVLKAVPVTDDALQVTMDQLICAYIFPHPLLAWSGHVESIGAAYVCMYVSPSLIRPAGLSSDLYPPRSIEGETRTKLCQKRPQVPGLGHPQSYTRFKGGKTKQLYQRMVGWFRLMADGDG